MPDDVGSIFPRSAKSFGSTVFVTKEVEFEHDLTRDNEQDLGELIDRANRHGFLFCGEIMLRGQFKLVFVQKDPE